MKSRLSPPEFLAAVLCTLLVMPAPAAMANGFSVLVSPPRFELAGKPGDVLRGYVEINNPENRPASLEVRTADWDMSETGATTFYPPELQPGSCRPWARIERHELRLPPQTTRRYRFQIEIPADAAPGECRLALLLQAPEEHAVITQADTLSIPVQARVAVIMYVKVGDASADLVLEKIELDDSNGQAVPVALVHNRGNAHARTSGFVDATDARGRQLEFAVAVLPILPGQTRRIPLSRAFPEGSAPEPLVTPLDLQGTLEWDDGKLKISSRLQ